MIKIIILAPIDNSLYSLLIAHLCRREPGVEVVGIVCRNILNLHRVKSEFRRDGVRLIRKVWRKLLINSHKTREGYSLSTFAEEVGLETHSLAKFANKYQIPIRNVAELNDADSVSFLQKNSPDLIIFTGGGIIRKDVLRLSGQGIFNVHMGILPQYRGMDVVEWPVIEGDHNSLGITLHFMDSGVDTGPIIKSRRIAIEAGDTFESIRMRFEVAMVELMLEGIRMARDGKLELRNQSNSEGRQFFVMHHRLSDFAKGKLAQLARK